MSLAAALVGWSFLVPRLPARSRSLTQGVIGGLLVWLTRAPLGLRPPRLWAGLRLGAVTGAAAAIAVGGSALVPRVRQSMADREPPAPAPAWLLVRIPVGTVWAEESGFRAALGAAGAAAFGTPAGRLLQAGAFGLSHIPDARATKAPVMPTVLVTGVAGWLFGWLADRCGSLAAPILVHLAVNEAGAIGALAARSAERRRGDPRL
ncbi:CAAX protease family protein [Mycobacterium parmense]|uniref:CAAX protease family protein n=1 Tax=Mycobacterium parmense TaxID=185642 RepID=A0A7I7Z253_9MYCO|nr:CAAX protease family protein [Mycobacterium parmense]